MIRTNKGGDVMELDHLAVAKHDKVAISASLGILRVIQIKNRLTGIDATGHSSHGIKQRIGGNFPRL